jgi:hypothetical protein
VPRLSFAFLVFLFSSFGLAEGPVFGGNLPAIRPGHVAEDSPAFELALSYLQAGDIARVQTITWEVLWDPRGSYDFRGIDTMQQKMTAKGVIPLWLLQPCPVPSSPWYRTTWRDWWMPSRSIWNDIVKMNTKIALHIIVATPNETPFFQLWNEPQGGKPGGSNSTKYGEWSNDLHELLYLLVKDLRSHGIAKTQLVGPAASSFGEGRRSETAEFLSMMPPTQFDWLSECGFRDCHIRLSAGGAGGNVDRVKAGFHASIDWVVWVNSKLRWPEGQKMMVTEFYVTPGDVGVPIGTDMTRFHAIAFDLLKASSFNYVVAWGLRPDENDSATDPWAHFGGMGDSLAKWRGN